MNNPKPQIFIDLHNGIIFLFSIIEDCTWGWVASFPSSHLRTLPSSILWLWPWHHQSSFFILLMEKKEQNYAVVNFIGQTASVAITSALISPAGTDSLGLMRMYMKWGNILWLRTYKQMETTVISSDSCSPCRFLDRKLKRELK